MVGQSKQAIVITCFVLALGLFLYLTWTTHPSPSPQKMSLQKVLSTISSQQAKEAFDQTGMDNTNVANLLFLANMIAGHLFGPNKPVPKCYETPKTASEALENVKNIIVTSFRNRTQAIDAAAAFNNINSSDYKTNMTGIGIVSIQLDAIANNSDRVIVFEDKGMPSAIKINVKTQNDLLLSLFNVLVQYSELGGTGLYMKRFIDDNIKALDDVYFDDGQNFDLDGKTVPVNFMNIAALMKSKMTPDAVVDPTQDKFLADAIQKNSQRPIPISVIAPLLIIPLYTTVSTFRCNINVGDKVAWTTVLTNATANEYSDVCLYDVNATTPIRFTGTVKTISNVNNALRARVEWDSVSTMDTKCKSSDNTVDPNQSSVHTWYRSGTTPTWQTTYLGTALAPPTYFAKLFESQDGTVLVNDLTKI